MHKKTVRISQSRRSVIRCLALSSSATLLAPFQSTTPSGIRPRSGSRRPSSAGGFWVRKYIGVCAWKECTPKMTTWMGNWWKNDRLWTSLNIELRRPTKWESQFLIYWKTDKFDGIWYTTPFWTNWQTHLDSWELRSLQDRLTMSCNGKWRWWRWMPSGLTILQHLGHRNWSTRPPQVGVCWLSDTRKWWRCQKGVMINHH